MGGPLQTGQVSSKSVRWLVPPLPGPFVDALLKINYIIKFSKDEKFLGEASEHLVEKDLRLIFVL